MSRERWDEEDFVQMKKVERAIIAAVLPLIQNIDPLLALYAMIRCARVMLRKGEPAAQKLILPSIFAYLEGRTMPPGVKESPLWLPPGSMN